MVDTRLPAACGPGSFMVSPDRRLEHAVQGVPACRASGCRFCVLGSEHARLCARMCVWAHARTSSRE
eukprot:9953350-Alexandrium_andersonii.AAC.1